MNTKVISQQAVSINHSSISIDGVAIFYREAGAINKPNLLLLHGYPSSSHMFRNVIPLLAEQFHILAPDLLGFGFSAVPSQNQFAYTFENFAKVLSQFLVELNIQKTSFYLFDYGAPIIMHLIHMNPKYVDRLIFQNCTVHEEGLGEGIKKSIALFKTSQDENMEELKQLVGPDYIKWEYLNGVRKPSKIAPEAYTLDQFLLQREGLTSIHLALKKNYSKNLEFYNTWQEILKELKAPVLIVWGENDEVFKKEGALALHRDMIDSKLIFYPTGHFALEEYGLEIAEEISNFCSASL